MRGDRWVADDGAPHSSPNIDSRRGWHYPPQRSERDPLASRWISAEVQGRIVADELELDDRGLPRTNALIWWQLVALRELGGSGKNAEINARASQLLKLSEAQLDVMHTESFAEIDYRYAWARTNLKNAGAIRQSSRAVWSLTEHGWTMSLNDLQTWLRGGREKVSTGGPDDDTGTRGIEEPEQEAGRPTWESILLERLLELSPKGFERLAQRILREAGFINVIVTGRSSDGGIDGVGLYRPSLISFPVYFQCKRYKGSVGSGVVRDFRGAMAGRGEKGLVITTGTFTREAVAEASRDGASSVELIDGASLCELLKDLRLGVAVSERVVESITVETAFFEEFQA